LAGAPPQTPLGNLQYSPRPSSWNKGALLLREGGGKGKRKGRRERKWRRSEKREGEVREARGRGARKGRRKEGKGKEGTGGNGKNEGKGGEGKLDIPILICFRRH